MFEEDLLTHVMLNPKVLYGYIRQSTRNMDPISLLRSVEGAKISEDKDKAGHLSQFFRSLETTEPGFLSHTYEDNSIPSIDTVLFTDDVVKNELFNLKESTSSGPDAIPAKLLKELASEMTKLLALIFQASFFTGRLLSNKNHGTMCPTSVDKSHDKNEHRDGTEAVENVLGSSCFYITYQIGMP
ncbi:unnamed protein product [Dibothriocephalus latus]|uniref:Uncharacterized protein n=1 Tax=Dibothriocephalus latus TaxID=60516 RepID=A0A3P7L3S5_DIBLA|nr:unnamed protein product [Dibothriocephalus latus]